MCCIGQVLCGDASVTFLMTINSLLLLKVSQLVGVLRHFQHNHAIEVGNVSHRAGEEHKYHAINNKIIQ